MLTGNSSGGHEKVLISPTSGPVRIVQLVIMLDHFQPNHNSQIRITVVAEDTTATDKMVGIAVNPFFLLFVLLMTL
jgi:hypothetical protein